MRYIIFVSIAIVFYFGFTIAKDIKSGLHKSVNFYVVELGLEK